MKKLICFCIFAQFTVPGFSQSRNAFQFGNNVTYWKDWKDWKGSPFEFFDPEVSFTKKINSRFSATNALNVFYGEGTGADTRAHGSISYRLHFVDDLLLNYHLNKFIFSTGLSLRHRTEHRRLCPYDNCMPVFGTTDPDKTHFDFGGTLKAAYNIDVSPKSGFSIAASYRVFDAGVSLASLGIFYGFYW